MTYKLGDDVWIFVGDHSGKMSKGKVVAVLDLPGWSLTNYVIEIPTHIDPLLEVRSEYTMRPNDPRINDIVEILRDRIVAGTPPFNNDFYEAVAIDILGEIGND